MFIYLYVNRYRFTQTYRYKSYLSLLFYIFNLLKSFLSTSIFSFSVQRFLHPFLFFLSVLFSSLDMLTTFEIAVYLKLPFWQYGYFLLYFVTEFHYFVMFKKKILVFLAWRILKDSFYTITQILIYRFY